MTITDPVTAAGSPPQAAAEPCVLLKLGEIVLKGRNRHQFERMLEQNIRAAVKDTGIHADLTRRSQAVGGAGNCAAGQPGSQTWGRSDRALGTFVCARGAACFGARHLAVLNRQA